MRGLGWTRGLTETCIGRKPVHLLRCKGPEKVPCRCRWRMRIEQPGEVVFRLGQTPAGIQDRYRRLRRQAQHPHPVILDHREIVIAYSIGLKRNIGSLCH